MSARNPFDYSVDYSHSAEECDEWISAHFPGENFTGKLLLDVGCRTGELAAAFSRRGAIVEGLDSSKACIATAAAAHPHLVGSFSVGDLNNLSSFPSGKYDYVICTGVLPYLNPDQVPRAVAGLKRVTRSDGKTLIVFQTEKPAYARVLVSILSRSPLVLFGRVGVPILTLALFPVSRILLGRKVSFGYLKTGVILSLFGVRFGYPQELEPFRVPTPRTRLSAPEMSATFLFRQPE